MVEEMLMRLGLTHNETQIYLCLLKSRDISAGDITKKTGIHRRNVYDAVGRLLDKGLINETYVNNRLRFSPVHPRQLLHIIEENKNHAEMILPELIQNFCLEPAKRSVKLYKGIPGIKACFTESLDLMGEGGSYYAMGCVDMKKLLGSFIESHRKSRAEKKVTSWTIFNHRYRSRAKTVAQNINHNVRVLPKGYYLPVQTTIFEKKVTCQILIHEEPFAIQVIDEAFAYNFKKYFEMLWDISAPK